jgi:hypothetical protein
MAGYSSWAAAIVSNLIGGLIFFWVDRLIFKSRNQPDTTKLLARVDAEIASTRVPVAKMGMLRIRKMIEEGAKE